MHTGVYKRVSDSKDTTRSSGTACVSVSQCMTVAAVQAPHHTEHTHTHTHTQAAWVGGRALQHAGVSTHVCESVCSAASGEGHGHKSEGV